MKIYEAWDDLKKWVETYPFADDRDVDLLREKIEELECEYE
jgi:hypothetical protein